MPTIIPFNLSRPIRALILVSSLIAFSGKLRAESPLILRPSGPSYSHRATSVPIWGTSEPEPPVFANPVLARFVELLKPGTSGSFESLYRRLEEADKRTGFSGFIESDSNVKFNFSMRIPGDGGPTSSSLTYIDENASLRIKALNKRLREFGLQCFILPDGTGARCIVLFEGRDSRVRGIDLFVIDRVRGPGYDLKQGPWMITSESTVLANPASFIDSVERYDRAGSEYLRDYDSAIPVLERIAPREMSEAGWDLIASKLWNDRVGKATFVDTTNATVILGELVNYAGAHELAHRDLAATERLAYLADVAYGPAPRRALGNLLWKVNPNTINAEERELLHTEVQQKLPEFIRENKRQLITAGLNPRRSMMGQIHRLPDRTIREFALSLIGENQAIRNLYRDFHREGH